MLMLLPYVDTAILYSTASVPPQTSWGT